MEADPHEREGKKKTKGKKKDTTNHLKQSKCNACSDPGLTLDTPQKTQVLFFFLKIFNI